MTLVNKASSRSSLIIRAVGIAFISENIPRTLDPCPGQFWQGDRRIKIPGRCKGVWLVGSLKKFFRVGSRGWKEGQTAAMFALVFESLAFIISPKILEYKVICSPSRWSTFITRLAHVKCRAWRGILYLEPFYCCGELCDFPLLFLSRLLALARRAFFTCWIWGYFQTFFHFARHIFYSNNFHTKLYTTRYDSDCNTKIEFWNETFISVPVKK